MIAATILYNLAGNDYANIGKYEEIAFRMFYSLMVRYKAKDFYTSSMSRTMSMVKKLEKYLSQKCPEILTHIKTENVC